HRAVVGLGDRLHDRQPQAGAAFRPRPGLVGAVEALEHALAQLRRDAGTVIRTVSGPLLVRSTRTSPCGACVCAIALRARLRSACASLSGSACTVTGS